MSLNGRRRSPHLILNANIEGRAENIEIPDYALRYQNFDRVTLPTVKTGIYHANLPSVFRYDIDDYMSKKPIENSRTSTMEPVEKFYRNSDEIDRSKLSYPMGLKGDVEYSASVANENEYGQAVHFKQVLLGENFPNDNQGSRFKSIIAGKENNSKRPEEKLVSVFRHNRVRMIVSDRPTHGHMTSYFDTLPVVDKDNSRRVGVANGYQFRELKEKSDGPKFKPYGNTSAHYKNYIMYYPKL